MNALPLILTALLIMVIAYRYYSAFLAAKVVALDDKRITPAHTMADGQNYHATNKWVLFGHHFAAIAGAGPLIGPVLAAQFGYVPSFIWLLAGVCLAGAVHDFMILAASIRRKGKSLMEIIRHEISPVASVMGAIAIFIIIIVALAGLGLAVVNALKDSGWGTFSIAMTIPIAIFVGFWMRWSPRQLGAASAVGVILVVLAVVFGNRIPGSFLAPVFTLNREAVILALAGYGFLASVLPVWMLLAPRDYLSAYMKVGTLLLLVLGIILVNPHLQLPAFGYTDGGGPIIPGKLFPFVFITIACGAISGFHALVSSGTTPKMLDKESDARMIGYGSMLIEGLVGVVALLSTCSLFPGDYFSINLSPEKFQALGINPVNLQQLCAAVGENVAGRPGGAVSLAVGFAQIFAGFPGLESLMGYFYHFMIMFEALFILTTIDAGTRIARFLVQEFVGQTSNDMEKSPSYRIRVLLVASILAVSFIAFVIFRYPWKQSSIYIVSLLLGISAVKFLGYRFWKRFENQNFLPASLLSTALVVSLWGYFIWTGSVGTVWPMFGTANQLLASIALAAGTSAIINSGRARYAWVTFIPMLFVAVTTLVACWFNITDNYLPLAKAQPAEAVSAYVKVVLTSIIGICAVVVMWESFRRWYLILVKKKHPKAIQDKGYHEHEWPEYGCC